MIFGKNVTEKVSNENTLFPPHVGSTCALPGEIGSSEIASFHCMLFYQKYTSFGVLADDTPNFAILYGLSWSSLQQCKDYHAAV